MLDATGELALPGSIKCNCLFAERTHEQFDESHFGKLRMACLNCKPGQAYVYYTTGKLAFTGSIIHKSICGTC